MADSSFRCLTSFPETKISLKFIMPVGKTLEFTYVSVEILATSCTGEVCFLSQAEPTAQLFAREMNPAVLKS